MRAWMTVVLVVLAGCERINVPDAGEMDAGRITGPEPQAGLCQSCGASVAVTTQLAPGSWLSNEECSRVCASVWCGGRPISGAPGCRLESATSVRCGSTAFDCGYCVGGCQSNPAGCSNGCCDFPSNCCKATSRSCRGLDCGSCPRPDARCSLEACRSFKACGGQLDAEPRASVCGDVSDSGIELAAYCPDACTASEAGAVVQEGCSSASDAGVLDAGLSDGGMVDAGTTDAGACECDATRTTCEAACPQTSARACLDCSADCAIDFARCAARCR